MTYGHSKDSRWIKSMGAHGRRCLMGYLCFYLIGIFGISRSFGQEVQNYPLQPEELENLKVLLIQEDVLREGGFPEAFQSLDLKEIQRASTRIFYLLPISQENSETCGRGGEFLLPNLFYSPLDHFSSAEMERLQADWKKASNVKADALLLDLRTEARAKNPLDLIPLLEVFVPSGTVLFRAFEKDQVMELFATQEEPFWKGTLHVLVDEDSSDSAKFLASLLYLHAEAQLFGKLDIEDIYSFASIPLSERTQVLLAEFQLRVEAEKSPLAQAAPSVVPLDSDLAGKKMWRSDRHQELKSFLFETAPERESERALLDRQDPELDFRMNLASNPRSEVPKRDLTLIQAVDLLAAQRFLKPHKIALPVAPKGDNLFELPQDP